MVNKVSAAIAVPIWVLAMAGIVGDGSMRSVPLYLVVPAYLLGGAGLFLVIMGLVAIVVGLVGMMFRPERPR